jgi:hypothetical protein
MLIKNKRGGTNVMSKNFIAIFTLTIFIVFNLSCTVHTTKKKLGYEVAAKREEDVKILGLVKTSGERIEFPKDRPARIHDGTIWGELGPEQQVIINHAEIERINRDEKGNILEILTTDGKFYRVISELEMIEQYKFTFAGYELISIPLSEVEMVWVKKVDPVGTFMASIGGVALTLVGLMVIVALTKESCPFIYSFDGERYTFDAEPYGGSICQGLKRTEWCGLEYLKEINSQYKIMVTNEVDETQYTDEIKLVVVDHPKGIQVAPDVSGQIHTISQQIIPIRAFDGQNRDLMPYISENDWIYWRTRVEEKNPDRKEDLRDELIFEFPKPEGATEVKLLFNGCNTLWGSQMLKQFLELYGNKVYEWYGEVNNFGPALYRTMRWGLREELYRLRIRVETANGWKSKGLIFGGGPFVSEDKVYSFDINDVPGDILRIKLTPPATFWMINYLAVDYTPNSPVQITEIEPIEAINQEGKNVREILAANDSNYLIMPNIGDSAELIFEAPVQNYFLERSFILKASGYYNIHLEAEGEPQMDIIERLQKEPGFTVQYAFKEYLRWKKENMMRRKDK